MDGYLDGSTDGFVGRLEVIEGRTGRRRWSDEEKARIAAESLLPGARVAEVARRQGTTRWQIYDWRRRLTAGALAVPARVMETPSFAALVVEPAQPAAAMAQRKGSVPSASGAIELVVDGVTVRVGADVDEAPLTRVIRAVRAAGQ